MLNIRLFPSRHADPRHLTIGDRRTDLPSQIPSTYCHLHLGFVQEPGGPSWSVTVGAFEGKGEREHERERRLRRQADDEGFSLVGKFSRAGHLRICENAEGVSANGARVTWFA